MELYEALKTFGLDQSEQLVLITLAKHQWVTALQLSQMTAVKRSTLYRVLERLMAKGLVEQRVDDKTTYFNLVDLKNLDHLVQNEETHLAEMKTALDLIKTKLPLLGQDTDTATTVKFYRGVRALQSLEWQRCDQPNSEILIFDSDQWTNQFGEAFAEEIRVEMLQQHIVIRELHSHGHAEIVPDTGRVQWTKNAEYVLRCYRHRQIDPTILPIDNDMYIQQSTITLQSYTNDEIIGITVTNPAYAKLMKSLFELAWSQASPIDNFG